MKIENGNWTWLIFYIGFNLNNSRLLVTFDLLSNVS